MRPLPQMREAKRIRKKDLSARHQSKLAVILLAMGAYTLGCGGGGAGSVAPPPPPPPSITVIVTPNSGTVLLGGTVSFAASVSNTTDTTVIWSINGTTGGSPQVGTISADGIYMAPPDLPPGGMVQVTATCHADPSKSATASVTVSSDLYISLSPNLANIELGATQSFQASIQSQGHPDPAIRWSLAGAACPTSCGTVDANGSYTAPQILPNSAAVSLIATSVADPSRQSAANLTVTSHFTLQISAPAELSAGATSSLVAVLTPAPGSNPNTALSWAVTGSGCTGIGCGVLSVTTTQAAGGVPMANTAVYTAPATPPQPSTVRITVTPQADPGKQVQANITIQPGASISISPAAATVAANHRLTLIAAPGGSAGESLSWSVNSIPGGNSIFGQICVTGTNPCQPFASGSAGQADYLAPGSIPSPNPVLLTVSSTTNPGLSASAQITVMNHVVVSVLPNSVMLPPMGVQSFTASVLGTSNQNVLWQIQGTGCGTPGSCGSIHPDGTYIAPAIPPNPNVLQVVALSQDDQTQSGNATVTISNGPNILKIHPASVYAGGMNGFTVRVDGSGFVPSNAGPGSMLMIGGTARVTTCATVNSCSAPVTGADVAQPGQLSIALRNPDLTTSPAAQIGRAHV